MKWATLASRSSLVSQCQVKDRALLIDTDLTTFVTVVYYATRSKSQYGMPYIFKTVLEDTTVYSFVMAVCHLVLALFVIFAKVVVLAFPKTFS
jgi:hypothetical protein